MSTYEMKDGQGSLFKNDRKESPEDNKPNYTGKIMIDGTVYQLAAWIKESKSGDKFMSLKAQLPTSQAATTTATSGASGEQSDLPF